MKLGERDMELPARRRRAFSWNEGPSIMLAHSLQTVLRGSAWTVNGERALACVFSWGFGG